MIVTHRVWHLDHQAIRNMKASGWEWDGTATSVDGGAYLTFQTSVEIRTFPRRLLPWAYWVPDRYWREFNRS